MKYTNKTNLPEPIFNILKHDNYAGYEHKKDCFCSVTELLNPAFQLALKEKYKEEIEIEVSDRLWLVLGNSVHQYAESILNSGNQILTEERVKITFPEIGITISGGVDVYDYSQKTIFDFKVTSVWTMVFLEKEKEESRYSEWVKQLNLYRIGYEQCGFKVEKLRIVAILRDWIKREADRNQSYIQSPIQIIEIPIVEYSEILKYVKEKTDVIKKARQNECEPCSEAERWAKKTTYAIMKEGRKTAVKANIENWNEAQKILQSFGKGHSVQIRKGESVRCKDYCDVSNFCEYWKSETNNE